MNRPFLSTPAAVAIMFAAGAAGSAQAEPRSLNDLTGPWQLLVDDHTVADKHHVVRTYHPFVKHPDNPIVTADKPWEGLVYLYGTVLPTEDHTGYRMWYQTLAPSPEINTALYATSPDGIHWDKPALGIRTRQGSTANNLFLPRDLFSGIASIIHTPWAPDPGRRYRIMNFSKGGFWAAYSPDGIHLTDVPDNPVFTGGGDVGQFLWDPHTRRYTGYVKNIAWVSGLRRRVVARITTDDFESWPAPRVVLAPDDFDDRWAEGVQRTHFYGLSAFAYESMYLGLLWIFRATDAEGYFIGPVFAELVTSHDGIHWLREEGDRTPMLPLGPPGSWDCGQLYTATQLILVGDTLRLYYGAADLEHGGNLRKMVCSIGLATLRKDGFASLDAGADVGQVRTKRLTGTTGPLRVNYACKPGGSLRVEVLGPDGAALPGHTLDDCDALTADSVDQPVTWGARSRLPDREAPIRLRFVMKNASLYSFAAGDNVQVLDEPTGPALGVLYTFEDDHGRRTDDVLTADGAQRLSLCGGARLDTEREHAARGDGSASLRSGFCPFNGLEIAGTSNLGTAFTLALYARMDENRHARLFSSYDSCGPPDTSELIFDYDPAAKVLPGLRLVAKGIGVESGPVDCADGKDHHLAVTYDDGEVTFYLDGEPVGEAILPGGAPVGLERDLFVGQDAALGEVTGFQGSVDDVLVLGRALSAEEVKLASAHGAASVLQKKP